MVCPGEFPGGPLVKNWAFTAVDSGSIPGQGTKISQAMQCSQIHTHTHTHTHTHQGRVVVIQSCPTLWDPMNCSTPGFPVLHHLPEFAQTHVHWVSDAIQLSHPLLPLSLLALNQGGAMGWTGKLGLTLYTIDTMYRLLIRSYCIAQGILLSVPDDLNRKEIQEKEGIYVYV